MKTVTLKDIRSWGPCYDPIKWVPEDWSGTALDVLRMDEIPLQDRLWVVLRKEMIDDRTLRIFACDCAERVLPFFEGMYPEDKRPRVAIEISRRYANGLATGEALRDAGDAAWAAARAAGDAARAAGDAAWAAAWAAGDAARAARGSVWDAAWAAGDAAGDEGKWQVSRLIEMLAEVEKEES